MSTSQLDGVREGASTLARRRPTTAACAYSTSFGGNTGRQPFAARVIDRSIRAPVSIRRFAPESISRRKRRRLVSLDAAQDALLLADGPHVL